MSRVSRRLRGAVFRVARNRVTGMSVGGSLVLGAVALMVGDYGWESWITDGLTLVLGATGSALVLFATGARRPDWEE